MWPPNVLTSSIDTRIAGTRIECIFHDFINNSVHFPLAIILIEAFDPAGVSANRSWYWAVLLAGALCQSCYLGSREYLKRPRYLGGNLICFSICACYLALQVGPATALSALQLRYLFLFSLFNGVTQELRWRVPNDRARHALILAESLMRSGVIMVLLWQTHMNDHHHEFSSVWEFAAAEHYHVFIVTVIPAYGILIGMANINAYRYLTVLRETATELRRYSEWFLGTELLDRSVKDPAVLELHAAERTVLFMDIRGFTCWSSTQTPRAVVNLINRFFMTSEKVLLRWHACKIELTGDEVMAVFESPKAAARGALELIRTVQPLLAAEGLGVGIGLNTGLLIEGMVGGRSLKKFSVMGDTVNTGKRICDVAREGELLVSENTRAILDRRLPIAEERLVRVKGKIETIRVHALAPAAEEYLVGAAEAEGVAAARRSAAIHEARRGSVAPRWMPWIGPALRTEWALLLPAVTQLFGIGHGDTGSAD